jgi:hypothetical protein
MRPSTRLGVGSNARRDVEDVCPVHLLFCSTRVSDLSFSRSVAGPHVVHCHSIRRVLPDGSLGPSAMVHGLPNWSRYRRSSTNHAIHGRRGTRHIRHRVNLPPRRSPLFYQLPQRDEAMAVVEGCVLVMVGFDMVVLHDTKEERTVSEVDHSTDISNMNRCIYSPSLVVAAPLIAFQGEPRANANPTAPSCRCSTT